MNIGFFFLLLVLLMLRQTRNSKFSSLEIHKYRVGLKRSVKKKLFVHEISMRIWERERVYMCILNRVVLHWVVNRAWVFSYLPLEMKIHSNQQNFSPFVFNFFHQILLQISFPRQCDWIMSKINVLFYFLVFGFNYPFEETLKFSVIIVSWRVDCSSELRYRQKSSHFLCLITLQK